MSTDLLFEQFVTLATAPDGIARLRELILQLAVQGKLGTQDAGDEPASVLLNQICEENLKFVNDRSRKKSKKVNFIDNGDFSLPIPKNWTNCFLEDITLQITDGEHIIPPRISRGIPLLTAKNVRDGFLDLRIIDYVDPEIAKKCWNRCKPRNNDVLMVSVGSIGRVCHIENPPDVVLARSVALLRSNDRILISKYLRIALISPYCQNELQLKIRQVAQPGLYLGRINKLNIPLPPLAEQHRIVVKVDRLMAICDELEARQHQERAGCLKLGTASLAGLQNAETPEEFERQWAQACDAFDLILDCPENVAVLRQTILQLAVQGRLVRQEPMDQCVGILFEKIKEIKKTFLNEKIIQKDKKFSPLIKEKPPWMIPKEWSWVRLQDIFEITRGGSPRPSGDPQYFGGNIPWITVGELTKDTGKYLNYVSETLTKAGSERSRFVDIDDLLLTNSGATLGVPKISKIRGCINDGVAKLFDFHNLIDHEYAYFFLFQQTIAFRNVNQGMGQPNLNTPILAGWFFPLPPLAEQHRIVAKVDALMALCDALEMRLKERAGVQGRLANAIVKTVADA